jgi:hypothetical protein
MTENPGNISCAEFQEHLPELIASGADLTNDPHLRDCDLCRALLADLETIADAARQLFPSVDPSDKLWSQIESAIQNDPVTEPGNDTAEEPGRESGEKLKHGFEPA